MEKERKFTCPEAIIFYSKYMNWVDNSDQIVWTVWTHKKEVGNGGLKCFSGF